MKFTNKINNILMGVSSELKDTNIKHKICVSHLKKPICTFFMHFYLLQKLRKIQAKKHRVLSMVGEVIFLVYSTGFTVFT